MAGAYLNQCMALSGDESSGKELHKTPKSLGHKSGLARDSNASELIADMSHYGLHKRPLGNQQESSEKDTKDDTSQSEICEEPGNLITALYSLENTIKKHCTLLNQKALPPLSQVVTAAWQAKTHPMHPLSPPPHVLPTRRSRQLIRGDRVPVYIRVVFLKIGEIDTMKENFAADAFVQAKWREPLFDRHLEIAADDVDWEKYWNPKLYVENNIGEPKENIWYSLKFDMKGEAMVYERRRIKGCFLENLELNEFPFDTQDLTLTITTERSEADIELEEDHSEISSINVQSFVDEQEWKLHSHIETWKRVTTRIYHNSKYKHPAISTSCRASRRPGFYIWNIFLVMLFICSLAFGTFSVKLDLPQNRLQLSFILLLTTITFKFVVSQTLPRISYLTYMDKYILTSMAILCAVCIWHSIVPLITDMEKATIADHWSLGLLGGGYAIFHLLFFLYIYFVALKKRWKYNEKDREHKERMKKMQRLQEKQWSDFNSLRIDPNL